MKRFLVLLMILTLVVAFFGCYGMSRTQQSTLSGAAIGAGGGALLGGVVGNDPWSGAVIGAGMGALGGYLLGETGGGYHEHHHRRYQR
jgi:osmotically inducible lipoprotein OsmB